MSIKTAFDALREARGACVDCGKCVSDCEVLWSAGAAADPSETYDGPAEGRGLSAGEIAGVFLTACEGVELGSPEGAASALAAVARIAGERPDLVFAVRRCCMCGHCTTKCPKGVDARGMFTALRELFNLAGVVSEADFASTKMDTEWHIFSVYRAVHGIYYQDLPHVTDAAARGADTLFFPGCPLASYAPELTREVFAWLGEQGVNAVISEDCCGSPFKSAGRFERGVEFKRALVASFAEAGIKRVVCVCPGCVEELEGVKGAEALEFVPLPKLMVEAGAKARPEKVLALAGLGDGGAGAAGEAQPAAPADGETEELRSEAAQPSLRSSVSPSASSGIGDVDAASDAALAKSVRVAVFDSCHDRAGRFGGPLRELLGETALVELPHRGKDAICCGAAGSVSLVDSDICARRAHRVLDKETAAAGAQLLVANCPTCSYTWAAQRRSDAVAGTAGSVPHANYLDLMFEASFDWDTTFSQLESMWTGEYGAWVCQQLL